MKPASMPRFLIAVAFSIATAVSVNAQTFPIFEQQAAIGIIDQDKLFQQSNAGAKVLERFQTAVAELRAENERIEGELETEELKLTELRKTMDPEAFNVLATEFDEKVRLVRTEQGRKERNINVDLSRDRAAFFARATDILLDFIDERGIEVLLSKENVILAVSGADITDAAIQRVNELLKD